MRNKTIISTAAFIIAFVFSAGFASLFIDEPDYQLNVNFDRAPTTVYFKQRSSSAGKIEALLKQDDRYGRALDRKLFQIDKGLVSPFASSSYSEYADSVSEYADLSANLATEELPQEFHIAWNKHMKAWRDYADFLDRMKNSSIRMKMSGEKLSDFNNEYNSEINSTWSEVLSVADEYGADFR